MNNKNKGIKIMIPIFILFLTFLSTSNYGLVKSSLKLDKKGPIIINNHANTKYGDCWKKPSDLLNNRRY